jgi:choline-phosphate cytidylyltransferase
MIEKIRVYTDGVFDLFHTGHSNLFKRIKNDLFEEYTSENIYLIVGITNDLDTHSMKGITVMDEKNRYAMVSQCKYVDEIIEGCPWKITKEFIDKYNIDWIARDDSPYLIGSENGEDIYSYVKSINKFKKIDRTENISSTDIISKIIRNYNHYLVRNLKRGMSRQELNLSIWKAFQVMFSYRLKNNEFITDFEKKIDIIGDSISESFIKKNREINDNFDEFVKSVNQIKEKTSYKSFTIGFIFGATGIYFLNNINMFKNINLKILSCVD